MLAQITVLGPGLFYPLLRQPLLLLRLVLLFQSQVLVQGVQVYSGVVHSLMSWNKMFLNS